MKIEDTVARWQAEEHAVRSRLAAMAGWASSEQVHGRTGLEMFQAIFAGELPRPPIGDTLDFVPIRITRGVAVFQGRPQKKHYNPMGTVHGGWFAALLDSAVGCAVHSTLPAGKGYTSIEIKVNYLKPVRLDAGPLSATGTVVKSGARVGFTEGVVTDASGKVVATATSTLLIFDL